MQPNMYPTSLLVTISLLSINVLVLCSTLNTRNINPSSAHPHHIFNAIHSSTRQWGSSLNHNGMSFFPAVVPKDTELYHGRASRDPVPYGGFEWLAFEPEHALQFAWGEEGRDTPFPDRPPVSLALAWGVGDMVFGDSVGRVGTGERKDGRSRSGEQRSSTSGAREQRVLHDGAMPRNSHGQDNDSPPAPPRPPHEPRNITLGYLHTYRNTRDLHLLYIDGQSAAKTTNGTLDSQDFVLFNSTTPLWFFDELLRAEELCRLAGTAWTRHRVDGFIRMEAGFEIILCEFEGNVEGVGVPRRRRPFRRGDGDGSIGDQFTYVRAVTDRYGGIGGGRIRVNYERMVSAFAHEGFEIFGGDEETNRSPRLDKLSAGQIARLRAEVDEVMDSAEVDPFDLRQGVDWQGATDLIVQRYAGRLKYLVSGGVASSTKSLRAELERTLDPFIDYENRDIEEEVDRCTRHFIPANSTPCLAREAVLNVSNQLCRVLVGALHDVERADEGAADDTQTLEQAIRSLRDLIADLDWTTWRECGTCAVDEVCFTPIWPWGGADDTTPRCANGSSIVFARGYWDMGGFPKRPGYGVPGYNSSDHSV